MRVSTDPFGPPSFDPMAQPAAFAQPAVPGSDYDSGAKVAGVLLTVFAPMIALMAALLLRNSQADPARRATLRSWAIASGVWLGAGLVIAIIAVASIATYRPHVGNKGPCIGGPALGSSGTAIGNGNYRFDCVDGGSTVVHLGN
jgi:hypothetical protein